MIAVGVSITPWQHVCGHMQLIVTDLLYTTVIMFITSLHARESEYFMYNNNNICSQRVHNTSGNSMALNNNRKN